MSDQDAIRFWCERLGWMYQHGRPCVHIDSGVTEFRSINDLAEAVRVWLFENHEPLQRTDMLHLPHILFQKGPLDFLCAAQEVVSDGNR